MTKQKVVEQKAASGERFEFVYGEAGVTVDSLDGSRSFFADDDLCRRLTRVVRGDDEVLRNRSTKPED